MNTGLFPPTKRWGLILHGSLIVALAIVSAWGSWQLSSTPVGPAFVLYLLIGLLAFAPIPLIGYRAYALYKAMYRLDRDTLELRWGLRDELIPLTDIEWVRPVSDLTYPLRLPPLPIPGAILGLMRHRDLGVVEFLASRARGLLLVGTPKRVYAISPDRPKEFLDTFARAVELGSLGEARSKSQFPSLVFAHAWESGLVRYLWLVTLFLNLGLAAWISFLIPSTPSFALGFRPDQSPEAVPSVQLIILPLVSVFLSLVGWIAGLFFYRWPKRQTLAIVLWAAGAFSSLLFLVSLLFIVMTPV
ncbi:MAG TPA: PH domain-containing protein [Anaerolineales bacterium]